MCLAALALAAGCGSPGIPEPPSLELARPVRDLVVVRKGNEVHLTWSAPTETTDHHMFRHAGRMLICRGIGTSMRECGTPVSEMPVPNIGAVPKRSGNSKKKSSGQQVAVPHATYTDRLSSGLEKQSPTENLVYAVSVLNSYGKSAGLSNQVQVPSAPTLPPPEDFTAHLAADGVRLEWDAVSSPDIPGLRYEYRVYRRDVQKNKDSIAGEVPVSGDTKAMLLDSSLEWENTYEYRLTVVTLIDQAGALQQVEGNDTPSIQVVAHDVFPPATPTGLQAAYSGPGQKPFIDLVWTANTEGDLAGYNLYRHEAATEPVKINAALLKQPAFRDSGIVSGHRYFYSVSAVDVRGNESPRSEEASETVPSNQ